MNERRRLLRTVGVALLPAIAGCTDRSDSGDTTDGDGQQPSTETDGYAADGSDGATATGSTTTGSADGLAVTLDNVSFRAWEVTADESGSVAPLNEENPTLTFEVGQRYVVENGGWDSHPLAFRDADDAPLLSQSADGSFEDDDAVGWTDDGTEVAFTVTEALAAAADYYICTVHSGMRGDVETA